MKVKSRWVNPNGIVIAACLNQNLISAKIRDELIRLRSEPWTTHPNLRDYSGGWDVLPLRCSVEHQNAHPILQGFAIEGGSLWQNLPCLNASRNLLKLLETVQCPLKSVRLMRLAPGAQIKPHRDRELAWEFGEARLHLPLCTDPNVHFVIDGETIPMQAGELWYMNADREHSVTHNGIVERIHLVIDCEVDHWLKNAIVGNSRSALCKT